MGNNKIREASHAGSCPILNRKHKLPVPGARLIIAPHAGYSYSGPAAAWAYKSLDLSKAKRVFLLGPSHAWYLDRCALSKQTRYATPLGDLVIDKATVQELADTGEFLRMSTSQDETEHSLEMHLPYIYKMLSQQFSSPSDFPTLVPILVGNTNAATEKRFWRHLSKVPRADESSVFITPHRSDNGSHRKVKEDKLVDGEKGKFKFVRYERSNEVVRVDDGSVSYASAYAIL
ncbi:hypothetical protein DID88_000664 [Monilinia fructigena]|uniref:AmmeMemoRadiSam system protein B n=1 Tax=Monilinia fructigena TaxID=38457 RepID=A0A395IKJ1_9HELO|nr:hypothetical protein DID88_000664 [Monilinia fructigena]